MSLSFDGVDDAVTSTTSPVYAAQVSITAWFNAVSQGEVNAGTLLRLMTSRVQCQFDGAAASRKLEFGSGRATTVGFWAMTTGFAAITGWKFAAFTYDGSATGNHPTLYVWDGATYPTLTSLTFGAGLTRTATPAGALAGTGPTSMGSFSSGTKTWDGLIGEVAIWDARVLSDHEVAAVFTLGAGAVPEYAIYAPLDRQSAAQTFGSGAVTFTVSGALEGENPPIRPAGRKG